MEVGINESKLSSYIFRQVKFQGAKTSGPKRVAEEVIIEVEDLAASAKQQKLDESATAAKPIGNQAAIGTFKKPQTNRNGFSQRSALANLVKRKTTATATATATIPATATTATTATSETTTKSPNPTNAVTTLGASTATKPTTNTTNALSLLSGYDNYSDSDDSD